MDFGIKHAIVENLAALGFEVIVVPGKTPAHQIMALEPHGLLISNGPGDPTMPRYAHETIWKLMGLLPTFGICLGHQLLALAAGGRTFKMKFGHRGANHPVKNLQTGKIEITSQNHGYAVDIDSLKDFRPTHVNLNDGTPRAWPTPATPSSPSSTTPRPPRAPTMPSTSSAASWRRWRPSTGPRGFPWRSNGRTSTGFKAPALF